MPGRTVVAANGDVSLAGTVWMPDGAAPAALVLMFPGSGPSDRDNDVLFPPIRDFLLSRELAVASFDKRGVGESTGDWLTASIETQADDLLAQLAAVRAVIDVPRIGLFGHSQGGWVVLDAASRAPVDFVITNSGPGVTPGAQESFSTANRLRDSGFIDERARDALALFDELMALAGRGASFAEAQRMIELHRASVDTLEAAGAFVPSDSQLWAFIARIVDYDPARALAALRMPVLALFGGADDVVPVAESERVYRHLVPRDLLDLAILPGGDHRMQFGDEEEFVTEYLPTIGSFVTRVVAK